MVSPEIFSGGQNWSMEFANNMLNKTYLEKYLKMKC